MNEQTIVLTALSVVAALQGLTLLTLRSKSNQPPRLKNDRKQEAIVIDTCALIDGRVRDLVRAGFITQQIFVSKRVLDELQYMADHGDAYKRSRARYGLDIAKQLREEAAGQVEIVEEVSGAREVDEGLIDLALTHDAALYTTDYNLNKVARIRGVRVMNVNELAHALRPVFLPGESVTLKIVQKGEAANQGVGYLEDGTMAVIEGAASRIGAMVTARVERMLQTEAGKMVFAAVEKPSRGSESGQSSRGQQHAHALRSQSGANAKRRSRHALNAK